MKRILFTLISLAIVLSSHAQERRVQNRPYTDLREFHFGVLVGTHLQDLELNNVGPQMVDLGDGNGLVQKTISVRNLTDLNTQGEPTEQVQELKTAYISCAFDLIAAAPRFNNHRPYVMLGLNPMLNLSGKDNDYIKLKRSDVFVEVGLGCDFYLPYFKLRPELKFMYSLTNSLDKGHSKNLQDKNMLMYTNSVNDTRAKMIALTFYFE